MKLVYSKGDKFCCAVFTAGLPEQAIQDGYVWISDEDYDDLINHRKCWVNGALANYTKTSHDLKIEDYIANNYQIRKLKSLLAETDYMAIKYAEGELSYEEYLPHKIKRAEWRKQINELQNKQ